MRFWSQERMEPHSVDLSSQSRASDHFQQSCTLHFFRPRQAGNWTWNLSSCHLGYRLSSQGRWLHYDGRDVQYMWVTHPPYIHTYLYISRHLSLSLLYCLFSEQVELSATASGATSFLIHLDWDEALVSFQAHVCMLLLICWTERREQQLERGHAEVNEVFVRKVQLCKLLSSCFLHLQTLGRKN